MSNRNNLANGFIGSSTVESGDTSFDLAAGYGATMPTVPFKITVAPFGQLPTKSNSEIMLVTARSSETLTVARAQDGTTAKTFVAGDIVSNSITLSDVVGLDVAVSTASGTAAKVGTTTDGNYSPVYGDVINVTFSSGCNVASPTLNIDGSGAKNIRLGNVNVTTAFVGTTSALTLQMWYDGTYWQIYGSLKNTTYSEISTAEITNTTSTTTRLISGRRAEDLMANEATKTRTLTNKTLTSPAITTPTGITKSDVGLGNVDNTSVANILLQVYPVGSIYMSVSSTNPGTLFGGTWSAWGSGRVPVGVDTGQTEFNTVEKTGGAKTHTLTIGEMPSHSHTTAFEFGWDTSGATGDKVTYANVRAARPEWRTTSTAGGGNAHNNLQPYITCYMFKRIS